MNDKKLSKAMVALATATTAGSALADTSAGASTTANATPVTTAQVKEIALKTQDGRAAGALPKGSGSLRVARPTQPDWAWIRQRQPVPVAVSRPTQPDWAWIRQRQIALLTPVTLPTQPNWQWIRERERRQATTRQLAEARKAVQ